MAPSGLYARLCHAFLVILTLQYYMHVAVYKHFARERRISLLEVWLMIAVRNIWNPHSSTGASSHMVPLDRVAYQS